MITDTNFQQTIASKILDLTNDEYSKHYIIVHNKKGDCFVRRYKQILKCSWGMTLFDLFNRVRICR